MNCNMANLEEKKLGMIIWKIYKKFMMYIMAKFRDVLIVTRQNYEKVIYRTGYFLCKNYWNNCMEILGENCDL